MIDSKETTYGNLYDYDDKKQLFFNPITNRWVKKNQTFYQGKK
jgi:hypothetical protein